MEQWVFSVTVVNSGCTGRFPHLPAVLEGPTPHAAAIKVMQVRLQEEQAAGLHLGHIFRSEPLGEAERIDRSNQLDGRVVAGDWNILVGDETVGIPIGKQPDGTVPGWTINRTYLGGRPHEAIVNRHLSIVN
jgi:hypothetical protein